MCLAGFHSILEPASQPFQSWGVETELNDNFVPGTMAVLWATDSPFPFCPFNLKECRLEPVGRRGSPAWALSAISERVKEVQDGQRRDSPVGSWRIGLLLMEMNYRSSICLDPQSRWRAEWGLEPSLHRLCQETQLLQGLHPTGHFIHLDCGHLTFSSNEVVYSIVKHRDKLQKAHIYLAT
jgi:hypothetical protein